MAAANDAVDLFRQASEHDAAGREAEAVPLYERALALGLPDARVDTDETRRYARAIRFYTEELAAR